MAKDLKQKHEHAIERVGYSDTGAQQPSTDNTGTDVAGEPGSSFRRQNRFGGGLSTVQSVENIDAKGTSCLLYTSDAADE